MLTQTQSLVIKKTHF